MNNVSVNIGVQMLLLSWVISILWYIYVYSRILDSYNSCIYYFWILLIIFSIKIAVKINKYSFLCICWLEIFIFWFFLIVIHYMVFLIVKIICISYCFCLLFCWVLQALFYILFWLFRRFSLENVNLNLLTN